MTDIVERLRETGSDLADDAADEIERLEERVADLQAQCGYTESIKTLEIERLTLALEGQRKYIEWIRSMLKKDTAACNSDWMK